jgi:O-antigen/teichoic acid export membrane protein
MVFRGRDQMGKETAVSVSNKVIALVIALPALALGAGISGVILALGLAGVAALGVAARLYRRLGLPPLHFAPRTARELFAAGAPIVAMTAATSVQPYLDAIILAQLAPAAVVGWFGAAKTIIGTLLAPASILAAAAYPRLARASGDPAALRQAVRSGLRPVLWLAALAAAGTYLFAGTAIDLIYGSSGFGPAATILRYFAPGFFLLFIDILFGHIIYAAGRGTGFAIAKIVSVFVGTALDFLLVPVFQQRYGNGGIGVVVAFALSELVVFVGAAFVLRRSIELAAVADIARALGAAGATVLLFRTIPAVPAWLGIPLCLGIFAAASFALGLMNRRDLAMVRSLLPPLVGRRGSTGTTIR